MDAGQAAGSSVFMEKSGFPAVQCLPAGQRSLRDGNSVVKKVLRYVFSFDKIFLSAAIGLLETFNE